MKNSRKQNDVFHMKKRSLTLPKQRRVKLRPKRRKTRNFSFSMKVLICLVLISVCAYLRILWTMTLSESTDNDMKSHYLRASTLSVHDLMKFHSHQNEIKSDTEIKLDTGNTDTHETNEERHGFVVLGMHRSGTSMLSGLMSIGQGYKVGGPLIGGHYDNPKGFFELLPIVLQNDRFLGKQGITWDYNVIRYDYKKALDQKKSNHIPFKEGEKGLNVLNDPNNWPWLQKDPRMCITLKTWLELLDYEPAALFTYRHPLEVAFSLEKRSNESVEFYMGLRLWIIYNMRAIQNSAHLCRVLSSNEAILNNPIKEIKRISGELTTKCKVKAPPRQIDQQTIDRFFDPNLQHKKNAMGIIETETLKVHNNNCIVYNFERDHDNRSKYQHDIYMKAMKIYCDLQNGSAYKKEYEWPILD